jgi:hypothetical protein
VSDARHLSLVIARRPQGNEATQGPQAVARGLPRRCAPRNDGKNRVNANHCMSE